MVLYHRTLPCKALLCRMALVAVLSVAFLHRIASQLWRPFQWCMTDATKLYLENQRRRGILAGA